MATPNPSIFRPEALQYRLEHQGQRQTQVTFPRWMARPAVIALWIMLALFGIGGGAACFAPVPVSASGLALVMGSPAGDGGAVEVAVLMPSGAVRDVQPGDTAEVFPGATRSSVDGTVIAVEPRPLDATGVEQRLGLPASSMSMLDDPVVLVWVRVDERADEIVPGSAGRAELPAGTRRAGAFLPLVGRFL